MLDVIKSGGFLMIPIMICGICSLFIIAERIFYFVSVGKRDGKLLCKVKEVLQKKDFQEAESLCMLMDTPCAEVIKCAVEYRNLDEENLREFVQAKMDASSSKLSRFVPALSTISNVSTLLGLLGTVTGNISAFGVLGSGGTMGDPSLLASSIAEALVTTVAGLSVSIPSIIFAGIFKSRVNRFITTMELAVTEAMFLIIGKRC